jgi:hypothetical protein
MNAPSTTPRKGEIAVRVTCPECGGCGELFHEVSVPECCGHPRPSGECCGNAVEGRRQTTEPCPLCLGLGYLAHESEWKHCMTPDGQWVRYPMLREREGNGWREERQDGGAHD